MLTGLLGPAAEPGMRLCDAMTIMEAGLRQPEESETIAAGSVFIFDQVEDLLRLQATDWDGQREFFRQLGDALEDQNRWALLSIREDFMGGLSRLPVSCRRNCATAFVWSFSGRRSGASGDGAGPSGGSELRS